MAGRSLPRDHGAGHRRVMWKVLSTTPGGISSQQKNGLTDAIVSALWHWVHRQKEVSPMSRLSKPMSWQIITITTPTGAGRMVKNAMHAFQITISLCLCFLIILILMINQNFKPLCRTSLAVVALPPLTGWKPATRVPIIIRTCPAILS